MFTFVDVDSLKVYCCYCSTERVTINAWKMIKYLIILSVLSWLLSFSNPPALFPTIQSEWKLNISTCVCCLLVSHRRVWQSSFSRVCVCQMSLVDLGKRLLEAARKGQDDEVRNLMANGAPFTTDWVSLCGTHCLHPSLFLWQCCVCYPVTE